MMFLKRAIKNREIKLEDILEQYRMISTATLRPEPIPLNVKVILLGTPYLYYLLYNLDEEYRELFKVKADFDSRMACNEDTMLAYAAFVGSSCKKENLMPFDRSGVAKIVEYGSRLAGHQQKLSSKFSEIADLLRESNYWAGKAGGAVVTSEHVLKAIEEKIYRSNRIEERLTEMILEGTLIIDTEGAKVGQVNGLAVLDMGDYSFGKPSRITASTYAGKAGVINIERETKMSGRIHEKAILIITHYIGSTYARKKAISFTASITFEQLYDMVEGDSATCAELYVILSSLSGIALKQNHRCHRFHGPKRRCTADRRGERKNRRVFRTLQDEGAGRNAGGHYPQEECPSPYAEKRGRGRGQGRQIQHITR